MLDSENSTSLSSVTRRRLLSGAVVATVAAPRFPVPEPAISDDPILPVWREWQRAYANAAAWSKRAGSLEHAMARNVGYPRVRVPLQSTDIAVWATSHGDIDANFENIPVHEKVRQQLHSDLATQQERWDAELEASGFNAADQNEARAWRQSEELADALFALRAQDILGVIIKLTLILRSGEAEVNSDEHPWPQIRSAYDDLRSLAGINDLTA